jgi:hypothetical protein
VIPKHFILKAPVDLQVAPLEQLLTALAGKSTQSYSGEYVGTGKTLTVSVPFTPTFIIIFPKVDYARMTTATLAGEPAVTLASNARTSWVPSQGFVKDAVTGITYQQFSIGASTKINTLGQTYTYFILG